SLQTGHDKQRRSDRRKLLEQEESLEAPRLERRLAAILAADVEGYSRHMERDEVSALATLSSHRLIVDDLIASHNGRITGTAGDICGSRGVWEHVRKMGQYTFQDLGEQKVKNIAQPIRAFRVHSANGAPTPSSVDTLPAALSPAEQHAGDPAEFELAFWEAMK